MDKYQIKSNLWLVLSISIFLSVSACDSNSEDVIDNGVEPSSTPEISEQTIEQYLDSQNFSGAILLVRNGNIQIQQGAGLVDRNGSAVIDENTVFRLASVSKQFTAAAILVLQQRGQLNVNDTVSTHIADYPNGDRITISNLLQHTSGIPNYTNLPEFGTLINENLSPEQLVATFKNLPLEFTPGSQFRYSNSGYALLGFIIETASGTSYQDFVSAEIFAPLQMTRSGYGENTFGADNIAHGYTLSGAESDAIDMSIPYAAGALTSTLNDLYLWDQSFYSDTLLSEETEALMFTPGLENYAFGWVVDSTDRGIMYSHGGSINGFSTLIARFPEEQGLIVVLSNVDNYNVVRIAEYLFDLPD